MTVPISTLQRKALEGDRQSQSILARFERRYDELRAETLQTEAAMHADTSNDGRNPLPDRAPDHVNASEVRHSDRWKRSRRQRNEARRIMTDPETLNELGSNVAILCARLAGEQWGEIPTAEPEARKQSKAETASETEARRHKDAVRAIVAKLDNDDDKRAIADGTA